ncbi:hypothetical protein EYF80_060281 [Liparis tanakae]|uniref:Uncharacterized protein n=1 Tax=Liparis tanakae TaxID=230148 RepID=A0A4Z2EL93_9TELE|nr:hypothetical protein EYF80_060281 [Liparis tanakae]
MSDVRANLDSIGHVVIRDVAVNVPLVILVAPPSGSGSGSGSVPEEEEEEEKEEEEGGLTAHLLLSSRSYSGFV